MVAGPYSGRPWRRPPLRQRVLIFTPHFWPATAAGGTARSVSNLVAEIGEANDVTVVTSAADLDSTDGFEGLSGRWINYFGARVYYVDTTSKKQWRSIYRLLRGQEWDVLLLNSMWNPHFSLLPASLCGLRYLRVSQGVLMPRGELALGALKLKPAKKKLGRPFVRALYERSMGYIGVTSNAESQVAQEWYPRTRQIRIRETPDRITFVETPPSGPLRVLFLGRIHPTKGLLELLHGLRQVEECIQLTVAGPVVDEAYWQQCQQVQSQVPSRVKISYLGSVERTQVVDLLHESDVLATLTLGENFGHTIAEALQAGCQVMTTRSTPWTELLEQGAGVVVETRGDPAEVARELTRLARRSDFERRSGRLAARQGFDTWVGVQPPDFISAISQAHVADVPRLPSTSG